jgi:hypothetical protein
MKMVRHNDERVQLKPSLAAIVEDCLLKQCRVCSDLKEPTALRGYSSDEVRASFLWSQPHMRSILQRPTANSPETPESTYQTVDERASDLALIQRARQR